MSGAQEPYHRDKHRCSLCSECPPPRAKPALARAACQPRPDPHIQEGHSLQPGISSNQVSGQMLGCPCCLQATHHPRGVGEEPAPSDLTGDPKLLLAAGPAQPLAAGCWGGGRAGFVHPGGTGSPSTAPPAAIPVSPSRERGDARSLPRPRSQLVPAQPSWRERAPNWDLTLPSPAAAGAEGCFGVGFGRTSSSGALRTQGLLLFLSHRVPPRLGRCRRGRQGRGGWAVPGVSHPAPSPSWAPSVFSEPGGAPNE